ncbi:hypothetical protein N7530_002352 [Penicillium desertorum]|uniref:Uncharacterized protein n=1 Tax=Penicillium desertorum TaxID=1303715 RepID=A0A9W9X3E0_9EURO|nr:hypothetical protein N7530_002352 [Penicillium desertorum]
MAQESYEDSIDDDGCLNWEDSVSEHVLPSINVKEAFPMAILQPVILSRSSLLTAIMYQFSAIDRSPYQDNRHRKD